MRRNEAEHRARAWLAWQTASLNAFAYHDHKRMPSLDSLTGEKPKPTVQTPEQMKAAFAAWRRAGGQR